MASNTASRCMTRLESVNAGSKKNSQRARVSRERPARRCCTVRSCGHNCAIFSDGRANFPALGHGRAECLQCCQSVIQDPKIADCQQAFAHGSVSHENHAKRWQANDKSPSPLGASSVRTRWNQSRGVIRSTDGLTSTSGWVWPFSTESGASLMPIVALILF